MSEDTLDTMIEKINKMISDIDNIQDKVKSQVDTIEMSDTHITESIDKKDD